ncbi:hypothetical protein FS837_009921 [Tulasnella sp. UAMH 9824]|nr:hypothetical protein FS837_009921 [Tulasnella sp. UAMH 9824]
MDQNTIASMTPQARRALLAYLAALGDEAAVAPVQPNVDPALTQGPASATQSTTAAGPTPSAPPTSSVASLPNTANGPGHVNTTPLSDSEIFNFLNLPPPQPPSAHATMPAPQAAVSPAFASPLTGNPALGYSPTAAQVLAASTGSVGGGSVTPSNRPTVFPTTVAAVPASSGTVPYGIPPVHRNTWGTSRSSAPGIPTQVPPSLGTRLFPPSNSGRQSHSLASMSAVLQPQHARDARATARQARKPTRGPIHPRHWFLVPSPDIEYLTNHVKVACTKAGLGKYFAIMKDYNPAQVDATIRTAFSSVEFDKYGYRYMELSRLTEHDFWASLAAEVGEAEQESDEDSSHSPPEEIVDCPICDQSFAESIFAKHERSCPGPPPSPKLAASSRRSRRGSRRSYSPSTASSEIPSSRSSIASSTRSKTRPRKVHLRVKDSPPERQGDSSPEPSLASAHPMPSDDEATDQPEEADDDHGKSDTKQPSRSQTAGSPDVSMANGDVDESPDSSGPAPPTICCFCDEPWPEHASAWLLRLVKDVSEGASPDPTPANPNHLDVSISKSINVCMRHRLEKDLEDNGSDPRWPTTINFDRLPERIMLHATAALEVVKSPRGNPLFDALEAKVNDGLDLKSIHASEDPLVRTNCGYYGEQGFTAIADTLRFSVRRQIKSADTSPLDPSDFYFYVIIPYVACLLIREDRPELDEEAAWKELARSNKFGMLHFPDIEYE